MRTRSVVMLLVLWSVVAWLVPLPLTRPVAAQQPAPNWEDGGTVEVGGLKVSLSRPRLVQRSKGYLWFPSMHHRGGDRLLAVMSTYADVAHNVAPGVVTFSDDGGLTWSKPAEARYAEVAITRSNGDTLLLPYYLRLKSETLATGAAYRIPKGEKTLEELKDSVEVSGWPRKIGLLPSDLGSAKEEWKLAGFVFNGQSVLMKDGKTHLATLYGRFTGAKRYSLVLAESADGLKWTIRSVIADEACKLPGQEGPCESALVRLQDDRLLCVYRLDIGSIYGHSFSNDDGKTWTEPKHLKGPYSVQPSLSISSKGLLLMSGGRPGVFLWFNLKGDAVRWDPIDLQAHHNKWVKDEPILKAVASGDSNSSSYTEVRWLDDNQFLVIYDRLAYGWGAIPANSKATNSIWVVRGSISSLSSR
ncbi:MAG: glycoside hydrolase [Gemmataceae bacterium]|nr:glycoside hydrolase [Gemmataceae bacterium]